MMRTRVNLFEVFMQSIIRHPLFFFKVKTKAGDFDRGRGMISVLRFFYWYGLKSCTTLIALRISTLGRIFAAVCTALSAMPWESATP